MEAEETIASWSQKERREFISRKGARLSLMLPALQVGAWKDNTGRGLISREWELAALNPELLLLPLFREGSFKGMLMIPTKSSVGTRERRIDLIRMASPFPVWISCNARLENKIKELLHSHSTPSKSLAVKWFYLRGGYSSKFLKLQKHENTGKERSFLLIF